jgi:hypothetical protein
MFADKSSSSFMSSSIEISLWSFATSSSLAPLSCLLTADMWKEAVRREIGAVHAGWKAARSDDCGRTALVERRAADRGAVRARFRRASIVVRVSVDGFAVFRGQFDRQDGNLIRSQRRNFSKAQARAGWLI